MRILYLIIIIAILCCCSAKSNQEPSFSTQNDSISTSIGMYQLLEISFPIKWINKPVDDKIENFSLENTSKENFNQLFYFVKKYYSDFYNESNPIKKEKVLSVPEFGFEYKSGFHKIDSITNLVKSYSINDSLIICLYKDGGRYNLLNYNEKYSIVRYMILYTFLNQKKVDSLIVFYDEKNPIESHCRYFYINGNEINTFDFFNDELKTQMLIEKKFTISNYGKILNSEVEDNDTSFNDALSKNWKGEFFYKQNLLDGFGRNSTVIVKINIIKSDSSSLEHFLADENGDMYPIDNNHFKLIGEISTGKKEGNDSLNFYSKKILFGLPSNLLFPVFTMYKYEKLYSIKSMLTTPPHNTLEELEIKKNIQ